MIKIVSTDRIYNDIQVTLDSRLKQIYQGTTHFEGDFCFQAEQKLCEITGRKYAFLTHSGTSAIQLMLMAKGVKAGDKVGCTNFSCPATVMPIMAMQAQPVFFDIDRHGQQSVQIDRPIDYLLVTGLYGDSFDYDKISNIDVPVLNDSAQSFGTLYKGVQNVKLGEASIISFSTNKNCPIFGTYGAILCDDDDLAQKIYLMRRNGYKNRDVGTSIQEIGINSQPQEDKAAQVLTSLERFSDWQIKRKNVFDYYDKCFNDVKIAIRPTTSYATPNYHKYVIFVQDKYKFRDKLLEQDIECQLHYTYNFAKTEVFGDEQKNENFPWTDFYKRHAISIPAHPWLTKNEMDYVVDTIKKNVTEEDKNLCQKL